MTNLVEGDDLRALVREVLRDVLPTHVKGNVGEQAQVPVRPDDALLSRDEFVVLASDADLDMFVRRLAQLCEDPRHRQDLQRGLLRFRIAPTGIKSETPASKKIIRIERGAVTERQVQQASREGARLVLKRTAVLTPLARDRARALGVEVEREK